MKVTLEHEGIKVEIDGDKLGIDHDQALRCAQLAFNTASNTHQALPEIKARLCGSEILMCIDRAHSNAKQYGNG